MTKKGNFYYEVFPSPLFETVSTYRLDLFILIKLYFNFLFFI